MLGRDLILLEYKIMNMDNPTTTVVIQCVSCQELHNIQNVSCRGYIDWQNGAYIQDSLADLSADDREMLISHICPECWAQMFCNDD
jgi:hypothetical protein